VNVIAKRGKERGWVDDRDGLLVVPRQSRHRLRLVADCNRGCGPRRQRMMLEGSLAGGEASLGSYGCVDLGIKNVPLLVDKTALMYTAVSDTNALQVSRAVQRRRCVCSCLYLCLTVTALQGT
jgi:hypothetical protein